MIETVFPILENAFRTFYKVNPFRNAFLIFNAYKMERPTVMAVVTVFIHSRPQNRTLQGTDGVWPLGISLQETAGKSPPSFIPAVLQKHNKTRMVFIDCSVDVNG